MNGITILQGDCRETLKMLPGNSVHCCVTSPPYFGLRDYGCDGQIGLEASPRDFIDQMVAVFREVRRVLRDDGTLWLNLGDSYANDGKWGGSTGGKHAASLHGNTAIGRERKFTGMKPKDLMGIPWRVALALQEDGWWLRSEIIWHKPNPMPESVTDRPTKSHEQIFLLTKSSDYFYDYVAVQEVSNDDKPRTAGNKSHKYVERYKSSDTEEHRTKAGLMKIADVPWERRNKRTVWPVSEDEWQQFLQWKEMQEAQKSDLWTVSTKPYKGAHFATFPPDLIEPCILAGTSEHGACAECGAPWERVVEKVDSGRTQKMPDGFATHSGGHGSFHKDGRAKGKTGNPVMIKKTTGWQRTCQCETEQVVPCVVLDPFGGSGTTGQVARDAGCHAILCELNPEYVELIKARLEQGSLLV